MRTRLAELEAQDSGKEAAAQSSAEAAEAAASVHKRLMAEWKAMGRKAARQAENAAKGVSKRYRGQHVRASLEVNSLGGVRLRMFISTFSTAGTIYTSGKGGHARHDPALHPALLAERKLELQDLAAAMPPDATKNTLDVQNRRKRLHAQVRERLSVAPPSAYHT